ncbi:MAG: serine hydrolase [Elusimicrobiota bacterium]|jgi:hypothetical protein
MMHTMLGWGIVTAAAAGLGLGFIRLLRIAAIGSAYKAKAICSAIFVSGRDLGSVLAEDVSADSYRVMRLFRTRVDPGRRTVTASFLGLRPRTAVYRAGLGATLVGDGALYGGLGAALPSAPTADPARPWPEGEPRGLVAAADPRLARAVAKVFTEPDPRRLRRTRAVVVVHDGRIAAEQYAPGFGPHTPLPGWSMAKGVMSSLIGILVGQGRLALTDKVLLPEWSGPRDPRREIRLDDLLRMRSGLAFSEIYSDPLSDVTRMLFASSSAAAAAAVQTMRTAPGRAWAYASGTTNILSRIMRLALERAGENHLAFPRQALFGPVGMRSAVFEPDAAGDFVGSSFLLATARDWARLGWLYAGDGVWAGRRVLPPGWVDYCRTPTPQSPQGRYGAHWWLKLSKEFGGDTPAAGRIPADAFFAMGHEGQVVAVIPSLRLVTVRLGLSVYVDAWDQAAFLSDLLDVFANPA